LEFKFILMKENNLLKQITAIFSIFMVFFYFGVGIYFIFFIKWSYLDRAVFVIMGSSFLFYGIYRAYRAYVSIREVFFPKNDEDD
jgi:hypothetical protein